MSKYLIAVLLTCFCASVYSQFTDSTTNLLQYSSSGSINQTNDSRAYLLNNALRYSVRKNDLSLNFQNRWIYGKQNQQLTNNDYSSTLDFNLYKTFPQFNYWGLANYNTSRSLKINNQLLAGVGIAYSLIDKENAYLNISNGILFDSSDLILADGVREQYETMRNSLRLTFRFSIWQTVTLSNTSFLQSSLSNSDDQILKTDAALSLKVNQWLSLTTSYNYNSVSRTKRENALLSYGLSFERYF